MSNTLENLTKIVLDDKGTSVKEKRKLLKDIRRLEAPTDDRWLYRFIVVTLSAVVIISLFFVFVLVFWGEEEAIPSGIVALGSTSIGALAGWLVPQKKQEIKKTNN